VKKLFLFLILILSIGSIASAENEFFISDTYITNSRGAIVEIPSDDGMALSYNIVYRSGKTSKMHTVYIVEYDRNNIIQAVSVAQIDTALAACGMDNIVTVPLKLGANQLGSIMPIMPNDGDVVNIKNTESVIPETVFSEYIGKTPEVYPAKGLITEIEHSIHNSQYDIDAIVYDSLIYHGKQTKVFAYIGIPKGASAENPVPAVVLAHGGQGCASLSWVQEWNKRGYAALAIDFCGQGPATSGAVPTHQYGGIRDPWSVAFKTDKAESGLYHTTASAILAHNILRSYDLVDNSKIGICGVSWGAVVSSIAVGADTRFAFAIPIYGGGYLNENKTSLVSLKPGESFIWDPSKFLNNTTSPVLFINSDTDHAFSVDTTSKSAKLCRHGMISIQNGLEHKQQVAEKIDLAYNFADYAVKHNPIIQVSDMTVENGRARVTCQGYIQSAQLYYITASALPSGGGAKWQTIDVFERDGMDIAFKIPSDATYGYIAVTDGTDIMSTGYTKLK